MSTMRISGLAERTGVPATTLRFYETAGLLPTERTPAGYRVYGQDAVERLAFIGAAKNLGLPLEKIAELLQVRDTSSCTQVKQDLRPRITARIADAEQRAAQLLDFASTLRRSIEHLDSPRTGPDAVIRSARSCARLRPELFDERYYAAGPGTPRRVPGEAPGRRLRRGPGRRRGGRTGGTGGRTRPGTRDQPRPRRPAVCHVPAGPGGGAGSVAAGGVFLAAALVVNFVVVPLVVAGGFAFLPDDRAVRLGVLLVLLAPCVDYVIVFSGLAGGNARRLLAATPLLLLAQMLALPALLYLFLGAELAEVVEVRPFVEAFVILIVVPLALAWLTQAWAARRTAGERFSTAMGATMVPLMAVTLLTVVASQVPRLDGDFARVVGVVPFYVLFLVVMAVAGLLVARLFRLEVADSRAIVFTGATRNSLVVLPLALALPGDLAVAGVVVVTQTLVEVIGMVIYVRAVPRLVR